MPPSQNDVGPPPPCPGLRECSVGCPRPSNHFCKIGWRGPGRTTMGSAHEANRTRGARGPARRAACLGEESCSGLPFWTLGHSPPALASHGASSYGAGKRPASRTLLFVRGMRFCTRLPLRSGREIQSLQVPSRKSPASSVPRMGLPACVLFLERHKLVLQKEESRSHEYLRS